VVAYSSLCRIFARKARDGLGRKKPPSANGAARGDNYATRRRLSRNSTAFSFYTLHESGSLYEFPLAFVAEGVLFCPSADTRNAKEQMYVGRVSTYDPTDLRGQEREREEQESRKRLEQEISDADLKWVMGRERGRRFVWRVLEKSGVFRTSFSTNALQMAFNEGQRNIGLPILDDISALCPELHQVMVKEQKHARDDAAKSN
jgi:hypothetical protein